MLILELIVNYDMKKALIIIFTLLVCVAPALSRQKKQKYDVAAFLYPAYVYDDPRLLPLWQGGMGEWETVFTMQKRNPGHYWDRKPLWGYVNEADPSVMEMEIEQATSHGVNVFIFDWYWFDGRPFMETTLDNGFLQAGNRSKMKFYLMWANHDALINVWSPGLKGIGNNVIWQGKVNREEFEKICRRNIEKYFGLPEYYKIDGKPVFMIYDIPQLVAGLGGLEQAVDALKWFKEETVKAGFPGLELQITMWSINLNYSGIDGSKEEIPSNEFVHRLGFTSGTHYQFAHFLDMDRDYNEIVADAEKEWQWIENTYDFPYYPHVSIGWDNSPRTAESAVVKNNTPENFEAALRKAKAYADRHPDQAPLITINSWNEWTETSYLMPDNINGYGYLDAVKHVFVDE